jgi:GTPase SAR1 family protein
MSTLLYNPDRKSKDQLISEFVVRTQVYDEIIHDLETSNMEFPEQHYLLVGQRGAGKTTLLNRLKYGVQDSEKLKDKLIPVIFNEEQYNISELANLWESIGQFLEDYQGFDGIYSEIEKHIGKKNFEELTYDILEKYLRKYNKRLVLLIDNIGDLLKKLDKTEVHRLREVLQTKKEIRLIAGSPFYLETILDYHQPLFEFFKVIRLDGLNEQETQNLLIKLGELNDEKEKIERIITETPERIETLRTLTGGVPRTIALMYRIFTDYNDESTVRDLERILDAVTPLYKHRMDDLPTQQQKIVDAVAKNWDAISVRELKDKVRIDSKNISAQLRQLEKNQVVEKKETGNKNHLYFLKERFFNIWYLMRYGRKDDKQKVIWLVRFLESWCSSVDIKERVLDYIDKIKSGTIDEIAAEFYGNVYAAFNNIDIEIKLLLKKTIPNNISNSIVIANQQLEKSILKYQKTENWDRVLELCVDLETCSSQTQKAIYQAVALIDDLSKSKFYESFMGKLESLAKDDPEKDLKPFFTTGETNVVKFIYYHKVSLGLLNEEIEKIESDFDKYLTLVDRAELQEKSFDYDLLTSIFCLAMAKEYYNLVDKFFDTDILPLKDILRPVYFTLLFLKEGKDSVEFLKGGPEIQKIILQILKRVEEYRKSFPSTPVH